VVRKALFLLFLGLAALVAASYLQRGSSLGMNEPSAGPDVGGKIAYARAGALWLYSGGKAQQLTLGPEDRYDKRDASPSFSPDGTQIVYTRYDEGFSDLFILSLSNPKRPEAITSNRPEGETGAEGYADQALWALHPAWAPNGRRIAYTSDLGTQYPGLYTMGIDGQNARKLSFLDHSLQTIESPTWSPDGTRIAVANYLTRGGKAQIWVLNTEVARWIELTDAEDGAYDPAWSPDGEWVAFAMREGSGTDIYVVPTDAEKWTEDHPTPVRLTTDGASRSPEWSPDGERLAYLSLKDGTFDLYAADVNMTADGNPSLSNTKKLTDKAQIDATSGISWGQ
jgi:TolB protein